MADDLYARDFHAWALTQASALRSRGAGGNALDYDRLADEIEDMGISERRACESFVEQILIHLMKLEHFADDPAAAHWMAEVAVFRVDLEDRLTASILNAVAADLPRLYTKARRKLAARLAADGRTAALPEACPYDLAAIRGLTQG